MDNEQLWKLLDSIQGHIRTFDTKAQVALGLNGFLAGLLGNQVSRGLELSSWHFDGAMISFCVLAGCSIVALLGSALYAIRTVLPRLHLSQPKSHFFFCHLVELYGHKFDHAAKSLIALRGDQISYEIATQVQTNAIICDAKSARSRKALLLMTLSLAFYLFSFAPLSAIAHRQASGTGPASTSPCAVASNHR